MSKETHSNISQEIRNRLFANLPVLFLYSLAINVLIMAGPLFMLQVYDRVIPSQSLPTLGGLFMLVVVLFMFLSLFEFIRSRIITRIALFVDRRANSSGLSGNVLKGIGKKDKNLRAAVPASRIRDFLRGGGVESLLDLLFVPVYLIFLAALHPVLAVVSMIGSLSIGGLTILNNFLSKPLVAQSGQMAAAEKNLEGQYASHAKEITTMGMAPILMNDLQNAHNKSLSVTHTLLSRNQFFRSLSKGIRPLVQAGTLAAGAYLVIQGDLTAGTMIAASIMAGRLLQPIDQSINHWPQFVTAKNAYEELKEIAEDLQEIHPSLPKPEGSMKVTNVTLLDKQKMAKGLAQPLLHNINFSLNAGDGLCIAGPSGAGKSILIDVLIGSNKADRGEIRLNGAGLLQWNKDELGNHLGYLSQNARLMPGTIAQNISRFSSPDEINAIFDAAKICGIHERILALPDGYETQVHDRITDQPSGLVQLICLARAVYGAPAVIVLDEPTSNLDNDGEQALVNCIRQLRLNGATVIVATHRPYVAQNLNKVLILNKGKQISFEDRQPQTNQQSAAEKPIKREVV